VIQSYALNRSGMAYQSMVRTWLSNASSEFLILLLYHILELCRGILKKLVMSVEKKDILLRYELHVIFWRTKSKT